MRLATIYDDGSIVYRSITATSVGSGNFLKSPLSQQPFGKLFHLPSNKISNSIVNRFSVVDRWGRVWLHDMAYPGDAISESRLESPYRLFDENLQRPPYILGSIFGYLVVSHIGEVFCFRAIDQQKQLPGPKLPGPSLFGGNDHLYVVCDTGTFKSGKPYGYCNILVITLSGNVWGHRLIVAKPDGPGLALWGKAVGIEAGYKLSGPSLFGGPDHRYVQLVTHHDGRKQLIVVTASGEVWARDYTETTIGPGYRLNGPNVFDSPMVTGNPPVTHVVVYENPPKPPH